MGPDICLAGIFSVVLCFAQEHHPNWLGMGMDIVVCPLL